MKFIQTADSGIGVEVLASRLKHELASGKKVLWLISGGSAIGSEVEILKSIVGLSQVAQLTVMLMDERYGPVGHADSNWEQLRLAGADFGAATAVPVMSEPLQSFEQTAVHYADQMAQAIAAADVIIGLFGLGPDGHTAGILPGGPATKDTSELVVAYQTPELSRITLTRRALLQVHAGYVFAFGDAKLPALSELKHGQKSFAELPSLLLRELPEAYVYNDQIEGETS